MINFNFFFKKNYKIVYILIKYKKSDKLQNKKIYTIRVMTLHSQHLKVLYTKKKKKN